MKCVIVVGETGLPNDPLEWVACMPICKTTEESRVIAEPRVCELSTLLIDLGIEKVNAFSIIELSNFVSKVREHPLGDPKFDMVYGCKSKYKLKTIDVAEHDVTRFANLTLKDVEMKQVHVIYGETGYYSDHCVWDVCSYSTKEKAQERVDKMLNLMKTLGLESRDYTLFKVGLDQFNKHPDGDPKLSEYFVRTQSVTYSIKAIDFID